MNELNSLHTNIVHMNQWPEIRSITEQKPPQFDCSWLPFPFGDLAKSMSKSLAVSTDMIANSLLGVLSICAQGSYVSPRQGWKSPINLYCLTVAQSGTRKSKVLSELMNPFKEWQLQKQEELKREIAESAAKKRVYEQRVLKLEKDLSKLSYGSEPYVETEKQHAEAVRRFEEYKVIARPELYGQDITTERLTVKLEQQHGKYALVGSEAGLLDIMSGDRYGNSCPNYDVYLFAYDGDSVDRSRMSGDTSIQNTSLALVLLIQPMQFSKLLGKQDAIDKGLLQRFLVVCPAPYGVPSTFDDPAINEEVYQSYCELVNVLLNSRSRGTVYSLSQDAETLFRSYYNALQDALFNNEYEGQTLDDTSRSFLSKHADKTARIAALFQMCAGGKEISANCMEKAIAIGNYSLAHILYALHGRPKGALDRATYVIEKLREHGKVECLTQTDIAKMCPAKGIKSDHSLLDEPLMILEANGYLRQTLDDDTHTGPRRNLFEINPALWG
ncbi:MAG: DUF3987 domain-containing protein [Eubacteriaceae bacterium]|jgi:hypothetical protein|nr:DUF3987 domain-containing protein [Eubacteriaceae bacterium]